MNPQVQRACFDSYGKWLLEGEIRAPTRSKADSKAQPSHTPWNLGLFDALVLADKMAGVKGGLRRGAITCGL